MKLWIRIIWEVFTTIILGRGVRMILLASMELVIGWYSCLQLIATKGTERAIYLLIITLLVLGATWHINVIEKDKETL